MESLALGGIEGCGTDGKEWEEDLFSRWDDKDNHSTKDNRACIAERLHFIRSLTL